MQHYLTSLLKKSSLLASTLEDLPCPQNRVQVNSQRQPQNYLQISPVGKRSLTHFRKILGRLFKRYGYTRLKTSESNETLAHARSTCRIGDAPKYSALDRYNRVHGLRNLYVVDASILPSSCGTNPPLTIAASTLRVENYLTSLELSKEHGGH